MSFHLAQKHPCGMESVVPWIVRSPDTQLLPQELQIKTRPHPSLATVSGLSSTPMYAMA